MREQFSQHECRLPLPVNRERAGLRVISNSERNPSFEITLTLTLSRRTGRGEQKTIPPRQGIIFIAALGVIIILTGLVLVFAQSMRTESLAAANRLSYLQADAVEQGAERWVMANVEVNTSDATTITQIPANALQVGNGGYFWCLNPDPDSDQIYQYGIVDESSKLNVNFANATQLQALPNVTDEIAASIVSWRGADTTSTSSSSSGTAGATNSYYGTLAEPYSIKAAPYESLEELMLIKDVDAQLMYGYDLNHDGVLSSDEQAAGGVATTLNGVTNGSRGIANDLTVYTIQPNSRVPVSNTGRLQAVLAKSISTQRANAIISALTTGTRGRPQTFSSLSNFYTASGMTQSDLKAVAGQITASTAPAGSTVTGLINANTASREVLAALLSNNSGGGTNSSDADALISARGNATTTSVSGLGWVVDALGPTKAASILDSLTSQSYQYSADIVAVSPDGRAFKRVKIVVDDRTGTSKIIFRKDLTSLGWPLSGDIRSSLRSGQGIQTDQPNSDTSANSVTGS